VPESLASHPGKKLGLGWLERVHHRLQTSRGTIWVAAFSTALMEGGKFKGRIGIITDITEAKNHAPRE
jgi:hypothetical protein